ncbi:DmsC/YnfH family molybdoenzyme membrane anchor subunit [Bacteroidota bacterium]
MTQKAFILDINKCTGCQACKISCSNEHHLAPEHNFRNIFTFNKFRHPDFPVFHLSIACNHCIEPTCVYACPAKAIIKDPKTGVVLIDSQKCIGCKYCSWACPYDAPHYNYEQNNMEKCNFCEQLIKEGKQPACINSCPTGALQIGKFNEKDKPESPGFPQRNTIPAISFVSLRKKKFLLVAKSSEISKEQIEQCYPVQTKKVKLTSEWPLLIFTFLASVLTGITAAGIFINIRPYLLWIIIAGLGGLLLSSVHLGKKQISYRSVLNIKKSWLSREILFFGLFMLFCVLSLILPASDKIFIIFASITGFVALYSIDKIYHVSGFQKQKKINTLQVCYTGLIFFAALSDIKIFFLGIIIIRLILYILRKTSTKNQKTYFMVVIRVLLGFLLPALFILVDYNSLYILILIFLLIGELIDRFEFYRELEIINPGKQMIVDFTSLLSSGSTL